MDDLTAGPWQVDLEDHVSSDARDKFMIERCDGEAQL